MDPLFLPPPRPYSAYAPIRTPSKRAAAARRRQEQESALLTTPAGREAEIARIARQLARVAQTTPWGRVQNDAWDGCCGFIFRLRTADRARERATKVAHEQHFERDEFVQYVLRRWYCFWGARLAELLFLGYPNVQPGPPKDHEVDFTIDGVPFDLKTSEVPRAYADRLGDLLADPAGAAGWFYAHQSRQRRFHVANRLFLVLCDAGNPDEAWRLRADVAALRASIGTFMARPRFADVWVRDADGKNQRAVSAVIPVLRQPGPRQIRLALAAGSPADAPAPTLTPPADVDRQLQLPFATD
jgi:hypothetical protein